MRLSSLRIFLVLALFTCLFPALAFSASKLHSQRGGPVIVLGTVTVSGGNGNNKIDPDECNHLTIELSNTGSGTATGVSAVLSTTTPEVIITQPNSTYPDIPQGFLVANITPFEISTSSGFGCGMNVFLTLTVTSSAGIDILNFTLATGNDYTLSTSTGTIVPGTLDIGVHCDDCSTLVALPFPYYFYGQTMLSASVISNGNLQFNSSDIEFDNQCLPASIFINAIVPHWDDLVTDNPGDGVFTSVSGAAPNRIFNIEWRSELITGGAVDFEVRLYEDRQRVDLIYGTVSFSGLEATVGIQKGTGSAFVQFSCNDPVLFTSLQITLDHNICAPGGGSCSACPAISLDPPVLPDGFNGVPYNEIIVAIGGTAPYAYVVTNGALPDGLNLNSTTGVISGTPTVIGTFPFTITATDNNDCQGSQNYTISITDCGITLDPPVLPGGNVGVFYSQTISANGGTPPYIFSLTGGALPDGLNLDGATGVVSGTPTVPGLFNFTITATDSASCVGSRNYDVLVCGNISLGPPTLPAGSVAVAYNQMITANGGIAPYTFAVTAGALPDGLTLNNLTGVISGTPTLEGSFNFTVGATDSSGCFGEQPYAITIASGASNLFFDDFEDGVLDTNWTYIKSTASWSESGGNLIGTSVKKTSAIASPVFAGCINCYLEASMRTAGGFANRVWLLHHYIDKANTIELLMKEETDRWILKQRIGKAVVAKVKAQAPIDPNVFYVTRIQFDGTQYVVSINGTQILTLTPAGAVTGGTVGFKPKGTTGTFGYIQVN